MERHCQSKLARVAVWSEANSSLVFCWFLYVSWCLNFNCTRKEKKKQQMQLSCSSALDSLEGDRVLAVVRLAVPDQEAGLFAGLQLELCLLPGHTAMVPAETPEKETVTHYSKCSTLCIELYHHPERGTHCWASRTDALFSLYRHALILVAGLN